MSGIIVDEVGNLVLRTPSLSVGTGGYIDLNDNEMIVDYTTSSPLSTIQSLVTSGYHGGAWDGSGIRSTIAAENSTADHRTAIGYAQNDGTSSGVNYTTFAGQDVDNTTVLLRYTYYGDATIDGTVNLLDFNRLAGNFNGSGKVWGQCDFNYDTNCNLLDFNLYATNYNQTGLGDDAGRGVILDPDYTYDDLLAMLWEETGGW